MFYERISSQKRPVASLQVTRTPVEQREGYKEISLTGVTAHHVAGDLQVAENLSTPAIGRWPDQKMPKA